MEYLIFGKKAIEFVFKIDFVNGTYHINLVIYGKYFQIPAAHSIKPTFQEAYDLAWFIYGGICGGTRYEI